MTTKITVTWPPVPGATKYGVAVNGKTVTSTVPSTVHGLTVANGDAVAITAVVPAPTPPAPSTNWWLPSSFINTPLPANPAIDPNSAAIIAELSKQPNVVNLGVWINGSPSMGGAWSTTVYETTGSEALYWIDLLIPYEGIDGTSPPVYRIQMPLNPAWHGTPDSDGGMVVIDAANVGGLGAGTAYIFETFTAAPNPGAHSVAIYNVLTEDGSARAGDFVGDLPGLTGLIRPSDVQNALAHPARGFTHGLGFATPTMSAEVRFPAARSDNSYSPNGLPAGACVQLDPTLDPTKDPSTGALLNPFQTMLAATFQKYGGYNAEGGGSWACFVQSTADGVTTYPTSVDTGLPPSFLPHFRVLVEAT